MSFLTSLRRIVHKTPVLRQVSQGFANAWGAGAAYKEFDAKIGIGEDGAPVPSQDQYQGFGRQNLAELASERYPNAAALLANYRQYEAATPRPVYRRVAEPVEYGNPEDYGDEYYPEDDLGDEEE